MYVSVRIQTWKSTEIKRFDEFYEVKTWLIIVYILFLKENYQYIQFGPIKHRQSNFIESIVFPF